MIFEDLTEHDFEFELRNTQEKEPVTIRLFFTNFEYKLVPAHVHKDVIEENYRDQKIEYELYFV